MLTHEQRKPIQTRTRAGRGSTKHRTRAVGRRRATMKKTEEGSPRKGEPEQDEVGISGRRASELGHRPLHHQEPIPTAAFKKEHATEVPSTPRPGESRLSPELKG